MTNYEIEKIARMQAEFMASKLRADSELLDLMFPPKCMNIEEAAEYTRIPIGTLYAKVSEIPHMKVGKRLVFTDRGLMRWMQRGSGESAVNVKMADNRKAV